MPIYTEPVSDEILLRNLEDSSMFKESKEVLILGCAVCANISLNIYHGKNDAAMNILLKPISMKKEISRLKNVLKKNNYIANSCNITGLCTFSERKQKKIIKNAAGKDTIIIMSCPGGLATVSKTINDKKIISGMKVKGFKSVKLKLKWTKLYVQE